MIFTRFLPAFSWFILSLVLLCLPGSTIPRFPWLALIKADKWVHIIIFFILCFLFSRPFRNTSLSKHRKAQCFLGIMVSGIAYGTIMEFIQEAWIANRSFELLDIAADGVGCLLAYWYSVRNFESRGDV